MSRNGISGTYSVMSVIPSALVTKRVARNTSSFSVLPIEDSEMKANLRKSLDEVIACCNMLLMANNHFARILIENQDLDDDVVVTLAEVCNNLLFMHKHLSEKTIPSLTDDIKIFGNEGLEKELPPIEECD